MVNGSAHPSPSATALQMLFEHGRADRDQLAAGERYAAAPAITRPLRHAGPRTDEANPGAS